jgi:aminoglycoside phosphotransferase (APT) family kinase protein
MISAATRDLEQFRSSLCETLAGALREPSVTIDAFQRRGEGYSWETYLVDVTGASGLSRRLAVKREPSAGLLGIYDVQREVDLLNVTRLDIGCPVPQVVGYCRGTERGRGYYVMERVEGIVPMPWDVKQVLVDESVRASLGLEVAGIMARLHAKDVQQITIRGMTPPQDSRATGAMELAKWYAIYLEHKLMHVPVIDLAFAWLRHRADSVSGRVSLVHNDLRIGNIMVHEKQVAAVLDWETAEFTDPTADLAKFNLPTFRGRSRLASGLVDWGRFLDAYEAVTDWRPDERALNFWTVLEIVKAAVGNLRGTSYFASGRTGDLRYANLAWQSHHSIRWLVELYEEGKWGH